MNRHVASRQKSQQTSGFQSVIGTVVVGNLMPPLAAFATVPILAHGLGAQGRGELAAATAPLLLAISLATIGAPEAVAYQAAKNPPAGYRAFWKATLLVLASGAISSALLVSVSGLLSPDDATIARLIALAAIAVIPSLIVAVARGLASGYHAWRLVTIERTATSLCRLIGLFYLLLAGDLSPGSATAVIAASPVLGGLAYAGLRKRVRVHGRGISEGRLASYAARIWVGSVTGILISRLDQVLLVPLSSTYQLGLYALGVSLSELLLVINGAVREVIFSRDAADRDDLLLGRSARVSGLISWTGGLLMLATYPIWKTPLVGESFDDLFPVLACLVAAVLLGLPGSIAGAALSARNNPGLRSLSLTVACLANACLIFVLVPPLGALGAAIATLAGNLLSSNLNIFFLWKTHQVPPAIFYGFRAADFRDVLTMLTKTIHRTRNRRSDL